MKESEETEGEVETSKMKLPRKLPAESKARPPPTPSDNMPHSRGAPRQEGRKNIKIGIKNVVG